MLVPSSQALGPSGDAAKPPAQPQLDLNIRIETPSPQAIIRDRAEAPLREQERVEHWLDIGRQMVDPDPNEYHAEELGRAAGEAATSAIGIKSTWQMEEEARAESRRRQLERNIDEEMMRGQERDRQEMDSGRGGQQQQPVPAPRLPRPAQRLP
jgi:hypothetical protein